MALPRQVRHLPLLDFFSRVTPKGVVVDKEVYVIHRSTLSSSNRVRAAVPEDLDHIGLVEYFLFNFMLSEGTFDSFIVGDQFQNVTNVNFRY